MHAILEALDQEPLKVLHTALRQFGAFQRLVQTKYLPRAQPCPISMDTQEAQEAVEVDESRMEAAAQTWAGLSEKERQIVQKVTDRICGDGQGEELAYDLDIRVQPDEEEQESECID